MTSNRMRRRRRRRAAAVDRCLLRYYRQEKIEAEVDRLLLPLDRFGDPSRSDSPQVLYFCPLLTLHGLVVRICGAGGPVLLRR